MAKVCLVKMRRQREEKREKEEEEDEKDFKISEEVLFLLFLLFLSLGFFSSLPFAPFFFSFFSFFLSLFFLFSFFFLSFSFSFSLSFTLFQFLKIQKAADFMIIHHSNSLAQEKKRVNRRKSSAKRLHNKRKDLHKGIADRWANKLKAFSLESFAHGVRLWTLRWNSRKARGVINDWFSIHKVPQKLRVGPLETTQVQKSKGK